MFYIDNDLNTIDKFDMMKFLELGEDMVVDSLSSYMLYEIPLLPVHGYYKITTEMGNPPMLSHNIYGDVQYWWILMWYNQLLSPNDLTVGLEIKYPALGSIEQLYLNASLQQKVS